MQHNGNNLFYVVPGIQETDPGFSMVTSTLLELGRVQQAGTAFWRLQTARSCDEAFNQINAGMLDRRIDSDAALLLLDPAGEQARWHLRQPLADLIRAQWRCQNNLLVSFHAGALIQSTPDPARSAPAGTTYNAELLERMTQLGSWAPLSRSLWYISTPCPTQDAFHYLTAALRKGDQISLLDSRGTVAEWQQAFGVGSQDGGASDASQRAEDRRSVSFYSFRGAPTSRFATPKNKGMSANHSRMES